MKSPGFVVALAAYTVVGCAPEPSVEEAPVRSGPLVYGTVPDEVRRAGPAYVALFPSNGAAAETVHSSGSIDGQAAAPIIDQFGLAFSPTTLAVGVGDPVIFTNSESALVHNVQVRSVRTDSLLFTEDAASGEAIEFTFSDEGAYDILCEYHPGMTALVVVTDASYVVVVDPDGAFELETAPGDYRLAVWSADSGLHVEGSVTVGSSPVEAVLRIGN